MSKKVRNLIYSDYLRYRETYTRINLFKEFIRNKAFRYSFFMRLYKFNIDKNNIKIATCVKIIKELIFMNSTIEIPLAIEVGEGLYMGHFSGITINPNVHIGNYVNIHKGVTIGKENRGKRIGVPKIGDKVWIGVNVTIVGRINIGDNVLIAPNSFVNFDVPSNSIVIGNEIKPSINATEGYIDYKMLS
ncbi:serine acetyltransferase [Clostridium perfringens]|uniref:serine acetyltransferase n=1 Tax=Clostridium perfringens TaxID=1502 RepID=UPI001FAD3452|nr:serine acetyltransferase [Clostridium perfringens]MDK0585992.1 serine acetyltransferase [Clostridium perfringens]